MHQSGDMDPLTPSGSAQDSAGLQAYLEQLQSSAPVERTEETSPSLAVTDGASLALRHVELTEPDLTVPDEPLSSDQILQMINTLSRSADTFVAARNLTTFGNSSGSRLALGLSLQRFMAIPPSLEDYRTALTNPNNIKEAIAKYGKYGQLGYDLSCGLAKTGLLHQASMAVRWTAMHHNPQRAVDALAQILTATLYPDTFRWSVQELIHITASYPGCNVDRLSRVLTDKYDHLRQIGETSEDQQAYQSGREAIKRYLKPPQTP